MDMATGSIRAFTPVISIGTDSLSTHGFGIAEVLKLAKQLDINSEIVIIGIQPEETGHGEGLSESVKSSIDSVINKVIESLN